MRRFGSWANSGRGGAVLLGVTKFSADCLIALIAALMLAGICVFEAIMFVADRSVDALSATKARYRGDRPSASR
jgi:hypothetical protein